MIGVPGSAGGPFAAVARWVWMSVVKLASGGARGRIAIWRSMRRMLESGFSMREALETTIAAAPRNRARRYMLRRWQEAYADGSRSFSTEVARWVPASEGLVFGALGQGDPQALFAAAARVAEIRQKQVKAVKAALLWPGIILLGTLTIVWWTAGELLPRFRGYSDPEKWTALAKVGYAVSRGVYQFDIAIVCVLVAVFAALGFSVLRWTGPGRRHLDDFPPWSFYRVVSGTAFMLLTLQLLKGGQDLNETMWRRLSSGASPYVRSRMEAVQRRTVGGMGFGRALLDAGNDFPDREIVTAAAMLDGREGWHEELERFLELWIVDSEEAMKAAATGLTVAMLLGCAFLTVLALSPAMQSFIHLQQIGR